MKARTAACGAWPGPRARSPPAPLPLPPLPPALPAATLPELSLSHVPSGRRADVARSLTLALAVECARLRKRLEGSVSQAGWTGPQCPNATYRTPSSSTCAPFCLFRLDADPYEYSDLAHAPAPGPGPAPGPAAGCGKVDAGQCLEHAFPILRIVKNSSDAAACCALCAKDRACASVTCPSPRGPLASPRNRRASLSCRPRDLPHNLPRGLVSSLSCCRCGAPGRPAYPPRSGTRTPR